MKDNIFSAYLYHVLDKDERGKIIKQLVRQIKASKLKFDSIAFSGVSGALIAPSVADKLGKGLIVVRKGEPSHAITTVEGDNYGKRYIIIDDQVSTGGTVDRIIGAIGQRAGFLHLKVVGLFLYNPESIYELRVQEFYSKYPGMQVYSPAGRQYVSPQYLSRLQDGFHTI